MDPYRAPETPAAAAAEQRLAARTAELARLGAVQRAREARRKRIIRNALVIVSALGALYIVVGLVLLTTVLEYEQWLGASLLVSTIGVPMALVFALGMKVPPKEGNPFGGLPNGGPGQ